jgi:hypothetical protein
MIEPGELPGIVADPAMNERKRPGGRARRFRA